MLKGIAAAVAAISLSLYCSYLLLEYKNQNLVYRWLAIEILDNTDVWTISKVHSDLELSSKLDFLLGVLAGGSGVYLTRRFSPKETKEKLQKRLDDIDRQEVIESVLKDLV